jgi:parallel beta-helix repeat protein
MTQCQGFHTINLTVKSGLTALFIIAGGITLPFNSVSASHKIIITAQAPVNQPVIYVNPDQGQDTTGNGTQTAPYKTITFALSQAQAGAVIQLASANYTQDTGEKFPLLLKPGIKLVGTESNKGEGTTISGGGFHISPTFARQNITIVTNDNNVISGLTITNPNQRGTGIWVESGSPTINNNTFTKSAREGVFVSGTGNPVVENNVFTLNTGNGISITKNAQGKIRNNLFQDTGFGLAIGGDSTPLVENNRIVNNKDGIFISETAQPALRNNLIENNKRDGIVLIGDTNPDLGTNSSSGGNVIRNNARYDLNNATQNPTIVNFGNNIGTQNINSSGSDSSGKTDSTENSEMAESSDTSEKK